MIAYKIRETAINEGWYEFPQSYKFFPIASVKTSESVDNFFLLCYDFFENASQSGDGILTLRESEILRIIHDNPMVSQQEIADMLNMTRSSVSVHITNMIKHGYIKGRGYVLREDDYSVIIGTSALDIQVNFDPANEGIDPHTSQLNFDISFAYHGSAKNLAENIARLDGHPYLISVLSRDQFGSHIAEECAQHGISTDYCLFLDNSQTTMFLDVKGHGINLSGMTNNLAEYNITPAFLETKYVHLQKASQIIMEDRLSRDTIDYLTSNFRSLPLSLMTSRRFTYINNYYDFLDRFYAMQFSFLVASYLAGMNNSELLGKIAPDALIVSIAQELAKRTSPKRHIVFPAPGSNICYLCESHLYVITPPNAAEVLDSFSTTRDAMMAGLLHCLERNVGPEETLLFIAACNDVMLHADQRYQFNMCVGLIEATITRLSEVCTVRRLY